MTAPIILGKPKRQVLAAIGLAMSQIKVVERLTIAEMGEQITRSDEMMSQYLAGEAEMGVTAWLLAVEAWPDLPERVARHLDETEKAIAAKQRSLTLPMPNSSEERAA